MTTSAPERLEDTAAGLPRASLSSSANAYWAKIRGGDVGSLPAVLGFITLVILFSVTASDTFPTERNAANLLNQSAAVIFIAMGLVFVLLLGEIDLSAGYTAGTAGATLAVLMSEQGFSWPVAVLGSLATGAVIGLAIGLLVARLGIPSFVVTLALFLGLQGVMLWVIGEGGTIRIRDATILKIMNSNLSPLWGWILFLVIVLGFAGAEYGRAISRKRAGLPADAMSVVTVKVVTLTVLLAAGTYLLNQERAVNPALASLKGVPIVVPFTLVFLVALTFLLTRTAFGRHVYAVGGNAEAARRAGINVKGIKTTCFVIGSTMAAVAGILLVSRDNSVSPSTGGQQTLLLAVAAAVIGGTSLFGGKGKVRDAVIGGLVIGVIANGLPLITSQAAVQYVVTALVLLLAASVDAISRRRAAATGR
jgi:D-xylose transport system permease protein